MPEDTKQTLEERIEYLEGQNEGLKRVGLLGLILIFIVGGLLIQNVYADMSGITTGGVVFREGDANRYALVMAPGGHLAYIPFDFTGNLPQLDPRPAGDLRGLAFYDSKGALRVMLGTTADDRPVLAVVNPDGTVQWTPLDAPAAAEEPPSAETPTPTPTP